MIEKITALDTAKYLEKRGKSGDKERYLSVLSKTPHIQAREDDVIKE